MSYLNYPDGLRSIDSLSPIDTATVNLVCAARDCNFAGDVEAAVFFLGIDPQRGRVFEYLWTCPFCEMEQKDEQDDTDRLDA